MECDICFKYIPPYTQYRVVVSLLETYDSEKQAHMEAVMVHTTTCKNCLNKENEPWHKNPIFAT